MKLENNGFQTKWGKLYMILYSIYYSGHYRLGIDVATEIMMKRSPGSYFIDLEKT